MSTSDQKPATSEESKRRGSREVATAPEPKELDALHTEFGDTEIADQVVEKVAGMAAREVAGVYAMGSAAGRAIAGISHSLSGQRRSVTGGVSIDKGERETAVDVSIVVEYGTSIVEIADNIRSSVIQGVEYATGLSVVEVNVQVTDVHLPGEDDDDSEDDNSGKLR